MNKTEQNNENAIYWILKEKEGLNKEETKDLQSWLKITNNKENYEKNKLFFSSCSNLNEAQKLDLENELIKKKPVYLYALQTLAASVVFVLCFFSYTYYDNTQIIYTNQYVSKNEINNNIQLPDKSIIDMDVKSKLLVTYYKNKRLVELLEGKVLFSVSKDIKRPFIIRSGKTRIEVLGTKFEVIHLDDINTINVIEGLVKVSYMKNEKIRNISILKKGDSLALNEQGKVLKIQKVHPEEIAAWKEHLLRFNKSTLESALKDFSRYDDRQVIIQDYDTSQLRVSGEFSTKELDKFFEALPFIYPIKIKKENNIIKIMKSK